MTTKYSNIKGYPGYYISKRGTLFRKRFYIHRLVYEAWVSNIPKGYDIDHINGIKTDNRVSNLRAVSRSENLKHNYELGFKGSNYIHTFSDKEREFIMKDYKENGFSIKKISLKYGYSRYFIHQVLKGIR